MFATATTPAIATPVRHHVLIGKLANEYCKLKLPLDVLKSQAGYYIGTYGEYGPCSRESVEYFPTASDALDALNSGNWTQRIDT